MLSASNGRGLFVTDVDAGDAQNFRVQLDAGLDGTLRLSNRQGLTVTGDGSASAPLVIEGSLWMINQRLLDGLLFLPTGGLQMIATITMASDDRGNTGLGGALTDVDSFQITIANSSPINDPPVNVVPDSIDFVGSLLVMTNENGLSVQVMDIDAGSADNFQVSLTVTEGRLSLSDSSNLDVTGNGTPGNPLILTGVLADINQRLGTGLRYLPGPSNSALLTVVSNDRGNTGTGGAQSDTDSFRINMADPDVRLNNPPVNVVPANFSTSQLPVLMTEANGRLLAVSDIDAGSAVNFVVTLSVPAGQLKLLDGTDIISTGGGSSQLQMTGSMANINAALARGVSFMPDSPFVGRTLVTMVSNDNGNTGAGGAKSATSTFEITVFDEAPTRNNAPINHLPPPIVSNQLPTLLAAANGRNLLVTDLDAGAADVRVSLSVPIGRLTLVPAIGVTVAGQGTTSSPLVLQGSLLSINRALAGGLSSCLQPVSARQLN